MPMGGQSLGKDVRAVLVTPFGATLNISPSAITAFDSTPVTTNEKRIGLDGVTRNLVIPSGWKGSFEVDRFDSVIEDYWATFEAAYYAGQNILWGSIQETIDNPDGSVSQYRYSNVAYDLKDLGRREGDKVIKMKLDFYASFRVQA